jgi:hypothetical protein
MVVAMAVDRKGRKIACKMLGVIEVIRPTSWGALNTYKQRVEGIHRKLAMTWKVV